MDSLPPNDPNRNNNNHNHDHGRAAKEQPYDGRNRNRNGGGGEGQQDGAAPMDILGDMSDSPMVVAMFFVGVVTWMLRERCIC